MSTSRRLGGIKLMTATAGILLCAAAMAPAAFSQDATGDKPGTISVSGEGTATVAPDMAVISLTVLREAKTARQALDDNNQAMEEVLAAMTQAGIAERDLQTSGFGIDPRYVYPDSSKRNEEGPRIVGYRVANSLTVRVRDLSMLGAILDKSVSLGVNQGGNIVFTNDDPSEAITEARRNAMADAIARASTLTEAAGIELGKVASISEQTNMPRPMPMMRAEMAKSMSADAAVPVASGENEYRVVVNVTWNLDQ